MSSRIHATLDDLVRLQFDARGFSLSSRQPVSSLLSGRHASRLRGRGLTFEELRDYRPGDDIRTMDWKATARLRKPHVRVYSEERERPVLLIVDQRMSMYFGSARTTKATAATELAALAAWRALESGDRVGALIFTDDDVMEVKPHRSRTNVLRICHELVQANQQLSAAKTVRDSTSLNDALWRAVNVANHDFLVTIITDFAGSDETTRKHSMHLAAHNDVLAALIYDPVGIQLSGQSQMTATDGSEVIHIPDDKQFSERFETAFREKCKEITEQLSGIRIPVLPICTQDPVKDQLLAALGARR